MAKIQPEQERAFVARTLAFMLTQSYSAGRRHLSEEYLDMFFESLMQTLPEHPDPAMVSLSKTFLANLGYNEQQVGSILGVSGNGFIEFSAHRPTIEQMYSLEMLQQLLYPIQSGAFSLGGHNGGVYEFHGITSGYAYKYSETVKNLLEGWKISAFRDELHESIKPQEQEFDFQKWENIVLSGQIKRLVMAPGVETDDIFIFNLEEIKFTQETYPGIAEQSKSTIEMLIYLEIRHTISETLDPTLLTAKLEVIKNKVIQAELVIPDKCTSIMEKITQYIEMDSLESNPQGNTALHHICANLDMEMLPYLSISQDFHAVNQQGLTPLMAVCIADIDQEKQFKMLKGLVTHPSFDTSKEPRITQIVQKSGLSAYIPTIEWFTGDKEKSYDPLVLAYLAGRKLVEQMLDDTEVSKKLGVDQKGFYQALFNHLIRSNKIDAVLEILESDPKATEHINSVFKFSVKDADDRVHKVEATLLTLAVQTRNYDLLERLMKSKDVNINQTVNGTTALMMAVIMNDDRIVDILSAHSKIDVNIADSNGITPYQIACEKAKDDYTRRKTPSKKIREMLMHRGANLIFKKPEWKITDYLKDNYSWMLSVTAYSLDAVHAFFPTPGITALKHIFTAVDTGEKAMLGYDMGRRFLYTRSHSFTGSGYKIDLTGKVLIDLSSEKQAALEQDTEYHEHFDKAIRTPQDLETLVDSMGSPPNTQELTQLYKIHATLVERYVQLCERGGDIEPILEKMRAADQLILNKIGHQKAVLVGNIQGAGNLDSLVKVGSFANLKLKKEINIDIDPLGRIADLLISYKVDVALGMACGAMFGIATLASHNWKQTAAIASATFVTCVTALANPLIALTVACAFLAVGAGVAYAVFGPEKLKNAFLGTASLIGKGYSYLPSFGLTDSTVEIAPSSPEVPTPHTISEALCIGGKQLQEFVQHCRASLNPKAMESEREVSLEALSSPFLLPSAVVASPGAESSLSSTLDGVVGKIELLHGAELAPEVSVPG